MRTLARLRTEGGVGKGLYLEACNEVISIIIHYKDIYALKKVLVKFNFNGLIIKQKNLQ